MRKQSGIWIGLMMHLLKKLPDIKGRPAGRFKRLTVADLKTLSRLSLGGHRASDGKRGEFHDPPFDLD